VRFPLLAPLFAALLPACGSGNDGYVVIGDDSYASEVETEVIDIGKGLVSDPGSGEGLNIDVAEGGVWRIAVTCTKGFVCPWDLVASVEREAGELEVADDSTFEEADTTVRVDPAALRIYMEAGDDEDYVELAAPEGATLTLDVMLEGFHVAWLTAQDQPPIRGMIAFVSGGVTRLGARSNPVAFEPRPPP
jgi:hypothetical protein